MFAYIGLGGLMVSFLDDVPYRHRSNIALIIALVWIIGWVWLIGALALGSARGGLSLLRGWIGFMGGMALVAAPFSLLPHPLLIVLGAIAAVAFRSWVTIGKAHWLHKH
jgi:hypothetical protein